MAFNFETKLESKDIILFFDEDLKDNQYNYNMVEVHHINIKYSITFEMRRYGIKGTYISVDDFGFTASLDDYEDEFTIEGWEKEFDSDDFDVSVCTNNMTLDLIEITSCEINFKDKTIQFN